MCIDGPTPQRMAFKERMKIAQRLAREPVPMCLYRCQHGAEGNPDCYDCPFAYYGHRIKKRD